MVATHMHHQTVPGTVLAVAKCALGRIQWFLMHMQHMSGKCISVQQTLVTVWTLQTALAGSPGTLASPPTMTHTSGR